MESARTLVVGAGLAGLAVATRLRLGGADIRLLEASARPGGQLHTLRERGLIVELGAEGFVARSRAVPELCTLLGIAGALVDQLTTDTYARESGDRDWVLLPPGEAARRLGFQVPEEELGRGIRSLSGGMGQLTEALVEAWRRAAGAGRAGHGHPWRGAGTGGGAFGRAPRARQRAGACHPGPPGRAAARATGGG